MFKKCIFLLVFIFSMSLLFSHSGRTDSNGGHTNKKTGEYHYHNSGTKTKKVKTEKKISNVKVSFFQSSLSLLGYYTGEITGILDNRTKLAIMSFQVDNNIDGYGNIDLQTKNILLVKLKNIDF